METEINKIKIEQSKINGDTNYLTHNFHTYPAKYIPQIPRSIIRALSNEGETVLDPFCGCGTTLVEAKLLGRSAIGVDLNPIATLISKAKTSPLNDKQINSINLILQYIKDEFREHVYSKNNIEILIPEFKNRDHWFQKNVLLELSLIKKIILEIEDEKVRELFLTAFSSIIVTVSNQESDTRFAAVNKNISSGKCVEELSRKIKMMTPRISEFSKRCSNMPVNVYNQDTRDMSFISKDSIDLVVTSPPYANTYDYYLYHKFRIFWLDFDVDKVKDDEIGSRNRHSSKKEEIDSFERDLLSCMLEIGRVLKKNKYLVIVIGDSVIRGKIHKANEIIGRIAVKSKFNIEREISYNLKENSRMFNPKFTNGEKLEHIIFLKNIKE